MMTDHQTALCSLLLGSFPTFSSGDAEAALAAYEIVMSNAAEQDLQPGFMILINGEYPGHDGRFAPTAPQLATAIRMARDRRLEHERVMNSHQARLPSPDIAKTPEQRMRAKAKLAEFLMSVGKSEVEQNAEQMAASKARWAKVNAHFDPPQDEESLTERLNLKRDRLGYSIGAPESDENAA